MHAAYFDMDGTLLKGDSNNFLLNYLLKKGIIDESFLAPIDDFHHRYMQGKLQIEDFVYYIVKPFIGMEKAQREAIIEGCLTEGGLLAGLRPGGIAEIEKQKAAGAEVMIVSSTVDYVIEPIARHLGVRHVAAAPMALDSEGRITGKLAGLVPYQRQKVMRIEMILQDLGLSNENSVAFGDSINDLEMLCFAGQGYLIKPSKALTDLPEVKDMPVLNWD